MTSNSVSHDRLKSFRIKREPLKNRIPFFLGCASQFASDYEIIDVHIPVTCCARTRKMSETAAISQECGDDEVKVDVLLRCDIFGSSPLPVCVKSVSHAVLSYIPVEIIHGESTSACRRRRRTVTPRLRRLH